LEDEPLVQVGTPERVHNSSELDNEDTWLNPDEEPDTIPCEEGADICESHTGGPIDYGPYEEVKLSEYKAVEDYFYDMASIEGKNPWNEPVNTRFNTNNGWTTRFQTLYDAEKLYSPGHSCTDCHEEEHWENRSIKKPEAYSGTTSNFTDHREAWLNDSSGDLQPRHAGTSDGQISSVDEFGADSVFKGGFAPKCTIDQRWAYDQDDEKWVCSGDIPWEQPVKLPGTEESDAAGLIIPHTNLLTEEDQIIEGISEPFTSFPVAIEEVDEVFGDLDTVEVTCWEGSIEDDPGENPSFTGTTNVDDEEPFGIYKEFDYDKDKGYACQWEYQLDGGEVDTISGEDIQGHGIIEFHKQLDSQSFDYIRRDDHVDITEGLEKSEWDSFGDISNYAYNSYTELDNSISDWDNMKEIQP